MTADFVTLETVERLLVKVGVASVLVRLVFPSYSVLVV